MLNYMIETLTVIRDGMLQSDQHEIYWFVILGICATIILSITVGYLFSKLTKEREKFDKEKAEINKAFLQKISEREVLYLQNINSLEKEHKKELRDYIEQKRKWIEKAEKNMTARLDDFKEIIMENIHFLEDSGDVISTQTEAVNTQSNIIQQILIKINACEYCNGKGEKHDTRKE